MSEWPRSRYARLLIGPEPASDDGRYADWRIRRDDLLLVEREARADLAARIIAAVEDLPPLYMVGRWSPRSDHGEYHLRAAVLDAIRREAS